MRKQVTPEQAQEMRRLYVEEKWSGRKVAEKLGFNPSTVYLTLNKLGVSTKNRYALSDDEKQRAIALYKTGMSSRAVGAALGRHPSRIIYWLHLSGVKVRPCNWPKNLRKKNV